MIYVLSVPTYCWYYFRGALPGYYVKLICLDEPFRFEPPADALTVEEAMTATLKFLVKEEGCSDVRTIAAW